MKVLITGASGIVGRYLAENFIRAGYQVFGLSRNPAASAEKLAAMHIQPEWIAGDIADVLQLDEICADMDLVIHAAGFVSFQPADRDVLLKINHHGTANVVNACLKAGCKLMHISSVACISPGRPMPCEMDERQGFNPERHSSDYAVSKYLGELEVSRGVAEGLQAIILNPVIVLAPGNPGESSAALVHHAAKPRLFQPSGWLNFIDARDLAEAGRKLAELGEFSGQRFILSGGCLSYPDFFGRLSGICGHPPPSFTVGPLLAGLAWRLEAVRSLFTGKKPLLTRFTAAASSRKHKYLNGRIKQHMPASWPRPLEETLQWILAGNA